MHSFKDQFTSIGEIISGQILSILRVRMTLRFEFSLPNRFIPNVYSRTLSSVIL